MINMRIMKKNRFDPSYMGFVHAIRGSPFDICVRVLGAGKGKLAFFEETKTTTLQFKVLPGFDVAEVRKLFEGVNLEDKDFFYSVSVPYVDKHDLMQLVAEVYSNERC